MTIIQWLFDSIGFPDTLDTSFIYYITASLILLIILDGIITFFVSGITGLTQRGRK